MADYTHVNGNRESYDSDDMDFINEYFASLDLNHVTGNVPSNRDLGGGELLNLQLNLQLHANEHR